MSPTPALSSGRAGRSTRVPIPVQELWRLPLRTREGEFVAEFTHHGLAALHFPSDRPSGAGAPCQQVPGRIAGWYRMTKRALERCLQGGLPGTLPPLDWSAATPFQRKVWKGLLRIVPGRTLSYGELARQVGNAKAARAVGSACGANPIPVLVPCHRVLASTGGLGGFSAGLKWKRKLLGIEGAAGEA